MSLDVGPLVEADLDAANRIYRESFTTFLKLPPTALDDEDIFTPRLRSGLYRAFAARLNGDLVGTVFYAPRGSMGVLGPLIVRPRGWTGNAGTLLVEAALAAHSEGHRVLFGMTHANSPRHIEFFSKFGVRAGSLFSNMSLGLLPATPTREPVRYSGLDPAAAADCVAQAATLTDAIEPGLDWSAELEVVRAHGWGETALVYDGSRLVGFAICHFGKGSEAVGGRVYVKFAAVRPGPSAAEHFSQLLAMCASLARSAGLKRIDTGISLARTAAWDVLRGMGYLGTYLTVAMIRPNLVAHQREDVFLLDDGR